MKPKPDASEYYKTLSQSERRKLTEDQAKKAQTQIREILGIKENRYEKETLYRDRD